MYGTTGLGKRKSAPTGQPARVAGWCFYFLRGFFAARFAGFFGALCGCGGAFRRLRNSASVRCLASAGTRSSNASISRLTSSAVGLVMGAGYAY